MECVRIVVLKQDEHRQAVSLADHPPNASAPMADCGPNAKNFQHTYHIQGGDGPDPALNTLPNHRQLAKSQHPHQSQKPCQFDDLCQLRHLARRRRALVRLNGICDGWPRHGAQKINPEPSAEIVDCDADPVGDEGSFLYGHVILACMVGGEEVRHHVASEDADREPEPDVVEPLRGQPQLGQLQRDHHAVAHDQADDHQVPRKPQGPVWVQHAVEAHAGLAGASQALGAHLRRMDVGLIHAPLLHLPRAVIPVRHWERVLALAIERVIYAWLQRWRRAQAHGRVRGVAAV
mmetsp:Transcript_61327/g.171231  ORF Transcript_61327/g.171231 Transcript_61327/m.171231 type:complete len:291 (-) Transcript_61327:576-1448(-)